MNAYDLLDAVGGIDPKYITAADAPGKPKTVCHFQRYYLLAAALFLLVLSGVMVRNHLLIPGAQLSSDSSAEMCEEAAPAQVYEESATVTAEPPADTGSSNASVYADNQADGVTGSAATSEQDTAKEAVDAEVTTQATAGDYPAMLMANGILYKDTGEEYIGEIDSTENAISVLSYTDEIPSQDGQQNFDRTLETVYFFTDEETLVVYLKDENMWRIFKNEESFEKED
ncbi:MAG: hypothetical protein K5682_12025 [Lachnospiraceae bacterium]|nr:hypothetical protein [Lachnospiraceae bacterium]